jgi:hypothetical protein
MKRRWHIVARRHRWVPYHSDPVTGEFVFEHCSCDSIRLAAHFRAPLNV